MERGPIFGLLSMVCFLVAFILYCFGAGARPFDITGLSLLGMLFLTMHLIWTGYLWRQMNLPGASIAGRRCCW